MRALNLINFSQNQNSFRERPWGNFWQSAKSNQNPRKLQDASVLMEIKGIMEKMQNYRESEREVSLYLWSSWKLLYYNSMGLQSLPSHNAIYLLKKCILKR